MKFYVSNSKWKYEIEKLCRLYLPFAVFDFLDTAEEISEDDFVSVSTAEYQNKLNLKTELRLDGKYAVKEDTSDFYEDSASTERQLAVMLADCFYELTGYRSPWGILTGVRPAKLMGKLVGTLGEEKAAEHFRSTLLVSPEKTKLCLECYKSEEKIISLSNPDSFSLYISVPFCPSRCNYCSFVSHSVEQAGKLIPEYVRLVCEEIRETSKIADECGLHLATVYIGGGTPTTLSADELTEVMSTVKSSFDMSQLAEYTVEAGRPDTVTMEKLVAIKNGGATRISINPQTMNDDVLAAIGRRHTVAETVEAYHLARNCGFDNINMDLIAGLNGDTPDSFRRTVDRVIELDPENVTVHSLSMKRASNLSKSSMTFDADGGRNAAGMVAYACSRLKEAGINPYYMYRQSKTVGNLENVGYAKSGYEGMYNVYIMDETHSILACGASAVTKLREPGGNLISRIFNYKYPYEYIREFDSVLKRKRGIIDFYKNCDNTQ